MVLSNLRFLVTHLNYGLIGLEPNYTHSIHTDSNFDDRNTTENLSLSYGDVSMNENENEFKTEGPVNENIPSKAIETGIILLIVDVKR